MTMTPEEMTRVRVYVVWDPPSDSDLDARFDALGTWQAVAHEAALKRLNEMLQDPGSWSAGGDYSESWSSNIEGMRKTVAELAEMIPVGSEGSLGFGTAQIVRPGASSPRTGYR